MNLSNMLRIVVGTANPSAPKWALGENSTRNPMPLTNDEGIHKLKPTLQRASWEYGRELINQNPQSKGRVGTCCSCLCVMLCVVVCVVSFVDRPCAIQQGREFKRACRQTPLHTSKHASRASSNAASGPARPCERGPRLVAHLCSSN